MTREGHWLQPRHPSRDVFEKDFPSITADQMEVSCPGCRQGVKLTRKAAAGKAGGWCARCNRGVGV